MVTKKIISIEDKLSKAAHTAIETIALAAADATKAIASVAAEATKAISTKGTGDHDLLIELKTRMDSLKDDIKDLKDGTTVKIADHENRLTAIESKGSKQAVMITVIIALGFIATTLLVYHMFGVKI